MINPEYNPAWVHDVAYTISMDHDNGPEFVDLTETEQRLLLSSVDGHVYAHLGRVVGFGNMVPQMPVPPELHDVLDNVVTEMRIPGLEVHEATEDPEMMLLRFIAHGIDCAAYRFEDAMQFIVDTPVTKHDVRAADHPSGGDQGSVVPNLRERFQNAGGLVLPELPDLQLEDGDFDVLRWMNMPGSGEFRKRARTAQKLFNLLTPSGLDMRFSGHDRIAVLEELTEDALGYLSLPDEYSALLHFQRSLRLVDDSE